MSKKSQNTRMYIEKQNKTRRNNCEKVEMSGKVEKSGILKYDAKIK